jgi:hypothetical protein
MRLACERFASALDVVEEDNHRREGRSPEGAFTLQVAASPWVMGGAPL